jgi:hypothetical protein
MPAAPCMNPVCPGATRDGRDAPRASTGARRVARAAGQEIVGEPPRERQVILTASCAMQRQKKLADAGRSATLPDVVPEPRRLGLRNTARQDAAGGPLHPGAPLGGAGHAVKLIEESRGASRPVTPPEIVKVGALRRVVHDQTNIVCGGRNRLRWRAPSIAGFRNSFCRVSAASVARKYAFRPFHARSSA